MTNLLRYSGGIGLSGLIILAFYSGFASTKRQINFSPGPFPFSQDDTTKKDTTQYLYSIESDLEGLYPDFRKKSAFDFETPSVIETEFELDTSLNTYRIRRTVGGESISPDEEISISDYLEEDTRRFQKDYFKERSQAQNFVQGRSIIPEIDLGPKVFDKLLQGGFIDIRPQGSAELIFKGDFTRVENPAMNVRQQRTGQFKFDQKIQLNVTGNIMDRINLGINFDTEANFEFENEIKLKYEGKEDDIVQLIEAGNVNLPLPGSLITGSQSLFGLKTKLRFGRLTMTTVLSQKNSEKKEVTLQGGAQLREFNVSAVEYDENRHFFLTQYFRDQYNFAMATLPVVRSQVQITRIEVWVYNRQRTVQDTRNVVAFMDLGEPKTFNASRGGNFAVPKGRQLPDNQANTLYENLTGNPALRQNSSVVGGLEAIASSGEKINNGIDYEKIDNARQLRQSEYTLHSQLGFISLNQKLENDEVLAVAFEYTLNGKTYQVGEFSRDITPSPDQPKVIFLKLLKGSITRPSLPTWDLMMKNIYPIGGFQVQREDFRLQVIYEDDRSGGDLNYIPADDQPQITGIPLIEVMKLDRLNQQQELHSDGEFDFLEGRTILTSNGRVIFPVLEPFGTYLRGKFNDSFSTVADYYVYDALYDSTKFLAEQDAEHNKFYLRGYFQSSSGREISLNAINVPRNSVKVTAGGVELQENIDYTVDYTLGRVNIINDAILNSGQVIKVSAETNNFFSIQQKTLIGSRFDYRINEDFNLGGSFLYLKETPITQKVNIGDEPIANGIYGLDGSFRRDSRFLTKMVDKLPFIETKEKSEIALSGEFAQIIPGHPKTIGKSGISYLDDFEGSEIPIVLGTAASVGSYWELASAPALQPELVQNASKVNDLSYNFKRAKLAWYSIDPLFFRNNIYTPDHIKGDVAMLSNHYMREVLETEVFPNKQIPSGIPPTLNTFDLAYFPSERGPYNFNVDDLTPNGKLVNPEDNWAGIMRQIEQSDFEAANIEYMEFWVMDPFHYDKNHKGGNIYINLGNISEDILKDGLKSFENGLPEDGVLDQEVVRTTWGYIPSTSPINFAFSNEPEARKWQDVGFDGLTDARERQFFDSVYLQKIASKYGNNSLAFIKAFGDPSGDNYHFYRGDSLDNAQANIIARYKNYNNPHGNSPTPEQWTEDYSTSGTLLPDVEDINNDFTLNTIEAYFQYKIRLYPEMDITDKYITDVQVASVKLKNGKRDQIKWYQFKIPIRNYDNKVGDIQDFRSIRFMRLFFHGFEDSIICRFGQMNLVRGDWRRYLKSLEDESEYVVEDPIDTSSFDITTVNIEENGKRTPVPYVLPPGIQREVNYNTTELLEQNEQALSLSVCNLEDGDARAAYKNTFYDIRQYERMKMYVHAEGKPLNSMKEGDLWLFIRLGTDLSNNYYEYSIPLLPTTQRNTTVPEIVWPKQNEIDIALEEFYAAKLNRDFSTNPLFSREFTVKTEDGRGQITIVGNPDLSSVRTMMIGVRNPSQTENTFPDDGVPVCAEVWVNELRVVGFNEQGGWAAIGRATAKLADFGKVTLTGNRTTIGFGGIEESLQERAREDTRGFDVSSSFELGKFFPKKSGIRIPMFYTYSNKIIRPEYDPLKRDIKLERTLDAARLAGKDVDSIKYLTEDFYSIKSLNFTNVQKVRTSGRGKSNFYDVENFSLTYAYKEEYRRNVNIEYDLRKTYKGILNYNYNIKAKSITPFSGLSRSKWLRLLTDFNFSPLPSSIGFRTELTRYYGERLFRSLANVETIIKPNYNKNFTWLRNYDYRHNLTRSLRLNYQATAMTRIDEPYGEITEEVRDSIYNNLLTGGRMTKYNQRVNLSYDVPIKKIPFLDWVNLRASYDGSYEWITAPPAADSLGNTIQNSQTRQLNGNLNFRGLYSKNPFFRTVDQGNSNIPRLEEKKLDKLIKEWEIRKKAGEATDADKPTKDDVNIPKIPIRAGEILAQVLLSLKSTNFNYSQTRGTALPGFMPTPEYLGQNFDVNAPGLPFTFGSQEDIRLRASKEGWLSTDTNQNNLYTQSFSENFTAQGVLEPFKNMRINLNFSRRMTLNHQELYRYNPVTGEFMAFSPLEQGNFSISYFTLPSAFTADDANNQSPVFQEFENNRIIIAERLSQNNQRDSLGFPVGYSRTSQQVLIPAFLAAYSGQDPSTIGMGLFRDIPLPNWKISYNGLSNLKIFEGVINNINLNHAYNSTYSVNNFQTSLRKTGGQSNRDNDDVEPEYLVQAVTITEQLAPLLGVDITWANNLTTRVEYQTDRNLSLSLVNYQLTEIRNRSFIIGIGYRTRELLLPFKVNGKKAILENDLNVRVDFNIRNSLNIARTLDEETPQPTNGTNILSFKPNIDYVLSKNLNLRIFFERTLTFPVISTSFPRKQTVFGFSLRYTLAS